MGDVRPHPHHVDAFVAEELDVARERVDVLPRQADHHPGAGDVAEVPERAQAFEARAPGLLRRVDARKELRVGSLNPEQVSVGAGVEPAAVDVAVPFAEREGDADAVAEFGADAPEDALEEERAGLVVRLA